MRIGIIGAGNVGRTLATGWQRAGHEIVFGVRAPGADKYGGLPRGQAVPSIADAASGADVVVLATPWNATENAIGACGSLAGKIVVDATNPLRPDLSGLTHGHDDSGGEQVARWANGAKVVIATENQRLGDTPDLVAGHLVPGETYTIRARLTDRFERRAGGEH